LRESLGLPGAALWAVEWPGADTLLLLFHNLQAATIRRGALPRRGTMET
jgi:hypothetical protein